MALFESGRLRLPAWAGREEGVMVLGLGKWGAKWTGKAGTKEPATVVERAEGFVLGKHRQEEISLGVCKQLII